MKIKTGKAKKQGICTQKVKLKTLKFYVTYCSLGWFVLGVLVSLFDRDPW